MLLALVRHTLEAELLGGTAEAPPDVPALRARRGAFVTLRRGLELRGCIGHVPADRPLAEVVMRMAVSAATTDPRFPPVAPEELSDLRIEISVLSEPVRVDPPDVARVQPGRDGVIVRRSGRQGVLLPQVATEFDWGPEALLAAACRKAGLAADAWREAESELYVFQADIFGE
ncbi:MAG: AmmeMemoRadiSam system protein A [Gemmatimonadales bacterium]